MNKITLHIASDGKRFECCHEDIRSRLDMGRRGTKVTVSPSEKHSFAVDVSETWDEIDALIAESRCEAHAVSPKIKVPVKESRHD